jgi:hypothetical protein
MLPAMMSVTAIFSGVDEPLKLRIIEFALELTDHFLEILAQALEVVQELLTVFIQDFPKGGPLGGGGGVLYLGLQLAFLGQVGSALRLKLLDQTVEIAL